VIRSIKRGWPWIFGAGVVLSWLACAAVVVMERDCVATRSESR